MTLSQTVNINIQDTEVQINTLDIAVLDRPNIKHVTAKIHPLARSLVLWRGQQYDEVGDYTQAQIESRILELLGDDLQKGLQDLFTIEVL